MPHPKGFELSQFPLLAAVDFLSHLLDPEEEFPQKLVVSFGYMYNLIKNVKKNKEIANKRKKKERSDKKNYNTIYNRISKGYGLLGELY